MSATSAAPTGWNIRSSERKRTWPPGSQSIAKPGQIILSYETYALVREMLVAHALPAIQMKGISRPVVPYVIDGTLGTDGEESRLFKEHLPGLDLYLDPSILSEEATARTRSLLQEAIAALDGKLKGVEA